MNTEKRCPETLKLRESFLLWYGDQPLTEEMLGKLMGTSSTNITLMLKGSKINKTTFIKIQQWVQDQDKPLLTEWVKDPAIPDQVTEYHEQVFDKFMTLFRKNLNKLRNVSRAGMVFNQRSPSKVATNTQREFDRLLKFAPEVITQNKGAFRNAFDCFFMDEVDMIKFVLKKKIHRAKLAKIEYGLMNLENLKNNAGYF